MYRYLRNTHLFLGLGCCLFLLMYGVSAVQMSHNSWFNLKPSVTESQMTLPAGQQDARALASLLMRDHGFKGDLIQVRQVPGGVNFAIQRPGTVCQIQYQSDSGIAKIRENRAGFIGLLNRIHHIGGLWHEYWLINLWAGFVGFVSLALFVIGGTGIYMWFKLHKERVIGSILLGVSLAVSLSLIVLIRLG